MSFEHLSSFSPSQVARLLSSSRNDENESKSITNSSNFDFTTSLLKTVPPLLTTYFHKLLSFLLLFRAYPAWSNHQQIADFLQAVAKKLFLFGDSQTKTTLNTV